MACVEKELPGDPHRLSLERIHGLVGPDRGPVMRRDLRRDALALVLFISRADESHVDVVILVAGKLAVHALALVYVRVVSLEDESDHLDESPLAEIRAVRRLRRKVAQHGPVGRRLVLWAEHVWRLDLGLQLLER